MVNTSLPTKYSLTHLSYVMRFSKFWLSALILLFMPTLAMGVPIPTFPLTPVPSLMVDTTAPIFDSLTAIARDTSNTPKTAIGGIFYLSQGERIFYTVKIDPSDTMGANNNVDFTIGADAKSTVPFLPTAPGAKAKTRNRNYFIQAGENGPVVLTALNFEDQAGNAITGTVLPNPTNIVVDTMAPDIDTTTHTSSNAFARYAAAGDTVTYDIIFNEDINSLTVNTPSTASNIAGSSTVEINLTSPTTAELIFTVATGDNGNIVPTVDFDITDIAGNTTTITDFTPIMGGGFDGKIIADTIVPTLDTVVIFSFNLNSPRWAKVGDMITLNTIASEKIKANKLVVTIAGEAPTITNKICPTPNCTYYQNRIVVDGDEPEGLVTFTVDFEDLAGNVGTQVTTTTGFTDVTIDLTAPTVPTVAIASNNALDTTLAKTNDTVTVTFEIMDNLSTMASLVTTPAATILDNMVTASSVTMAAAGQTIARFTDGTEDSEVVVPFEFQVADIAGNISALINATTDGSQVQFDRTDPVVRNVKISAISVDGSASQDDIPTYYAKQGDKILLTLQICDYVDSLNNPPTGTIFGQPVTMQEIGLVGGTCTTGDGNLSQWRRWRTLIINIDGTEGVVPFNVTAKDNAGNMLANITGTTEGSQVIFDKTPPTTPTDVLDLDGVATPNYKTIDKADYTWSNEEDPMGGTPLSGLYQNDIRYFNPNTGVNEMVTLNYPTQAFTPTSVIPDVDPYIVFMNVRDKAGNGSGETNTYEQRYGIKMSGQILNEVGQPVPDGIVQVIAVSGQTCDGVSPLCFVRTDNNGMFDLVVAPNQTYTVNYFGTRNLSLEKQLLMVTTADVDNVVQLELVEEGEIQTLNSTVLIVTDLNFVAGTETIPTQILVGALSGTVETEKIDQNTFKITSISDIGSVVSNNPDVIITRIDDNSFFVQNGGQVKQVTDTGTQTDDGRGAFASGGSNLGIVGNSGNGGLGTYSGMTREERAGLNAPITYAESMAFAAKYNEGSESKIHTYINRNGYELFAGYQIGKMGLAEFDNRMENFIVFRGDKTNNEELDEFANEDLAPQQARLKTAFQSPKDDISLRDRLAGTPNQYRYQSLQTLIATNDIRPVQNYRKNWDVYTGLDTRKEYLENYVDKFERHTRNLSNLSKSRINNTVNPYNIRLKHGNKSVNIGRILDKQVGTPQIVKRSQQAIIFGQ